jgi:hypothetical protein
MSRREPQGNGLGASNELAVSKRAKRSNWESDQRAQKGPYSSEVEDYTDEKMKTPKDNKKKAND